MNKFHEKTLKFEQIRYQKFVLRSILLSNLQERGSNMRSIRYPTYGPHQWRGHRGRFQLCLPHAILQPSLRFSSKKSKFCDRREQNFDFFDENHKLFDWILKFSSTLASICSRTSCLISPVSPAKRAKKPMTKFWWKNYENGTKSCKFDAKSLVLLFKSRRFGRLRLPSLLAFVKLKFSSTLRAAVNNVDLVKSDGVDNLLAFLKLAFRALHESHLRAHSIVVSGMSERSAKERDLSGGLVNCDDIARSDFFLLDGLDHLGTWYKIIYKNLWKWKFWYIKIMDKFELQNLFFGMILVVFRQKIENLMSNRDRRWSPFRWSSRWAFRT